MNRLTKTQKDKVKQFCQITNASEATAIPILECAAWKVDAAIEIHFTSDMREPSRMPRNDGNIEALFKEYADNPRDNLPGKIGPHGVMKFLEDVGIDPSSRAVLIFAWKLNAEIQCEFSKKEWCDGLAALGLDTKDKIRNWMRKADDNIADVSNLRKFYNFAFGYAKSIQSRGLAQDIAVAYWRIIFGNQNKKVEDFIRFIQRDNKGLTKDEWQLFFEFLHSIKDDFSNYDADGGAWPVRFDEYVEYCKQKGNNEPMEN